MKTLAAGFLIAGLLVFACAQSAKAFKLIPDQPKTYLTLNSNYTLTLKGVVSPESVAKLEVKLMEMSQKLKPTDTIYLVLDTPGGSVEDGEQLIDFIHGLPQKVKTVTIFAASMGFHIAQNLDERLVLPNGTLMSHRATLGGLQGQFPGEYNSRLNFIARMLDKADIQAATRMDLSKEKYQALIYNELWVKGVESVEMNAADKVVLAKCDSSLNGTEDVVLGSFFGVLITGTVSKCPLITGVLGIHADGGDEDSKAKAIEMAKLLISDKVAFVHRYISR